MTQSRAARYKAYRRARRSGGSRRIFRRVDSLSSIGSAHPTYSQRGHSPVSSLRRPPSLTLRYAPHLRHSTLWLAIRTFSRFRGAVSSPKRGTPSARDG
jgi:hypothetical protein